MRPNYTVHPLQLGEADVPGIIDVFWSLTKSVDKVTVPVFAFLILGGPDPILVDTGMRSAERAMSVHKLGPHRIPPGMTLREQLAGHGLSCGDIKTVILTHLHYDHAGGCEDLPNATFYVQRSELAAAAAPLGPRQLELGSRELFYDRKDVATLIDPLWDRVELLEGNAPIADGIECIFYPGTHTPGSQCVYVETKCGTIGIVGDIVRKVDLNIAKGIPPGIFYDLEQMMRAMADIPRRASIIYPAHDPEVLEKAKSLARCT